MFIQFMKYKNKFGIKTWDWCAVTWNGFAQEENLIWTKLNN